MTAPIHPTVPLYADPEFGSIDDLLGHGIRVDDPTDDGLASAMRQTLERDGLAPLPGFLDGPAVAALIADVEAAARWTPIMTDVRSPYAGPAPSDGCGPLPETRWVAGHVTRDMFTPVSAAQRLYVSPGFKRFIARCVGMPQVYEYADPLAGLVATVIPPGGIYGWHFDTNEFVVTIALQAAELGGRFEFHRDLRRPNDENVAGVRRAMAGDLGPPSSTSAQPGDLQIFRGRYSLHRISPVRGGSDRLTLVLSYADRPGVIGPVERTRRVYGRVTEAHLVAERTATGHDGLLL